MIEPHEELEVLLADLQAERWQPTGAEKAAARTVLEAGDYSPSILRLAIESADQELPFFAALERASMVLDLPEVHASRTARADLIRALRTLLQAVDH